jgi:hypothetical protein
VLRRSRELGSSRLEAVEGQLRELERLAPGCPKLQYVRFLACLHHGDYPAATEALHRYFDYGTGHDGRALTAEGGAKGQTGRFQNALLNLGSMHVHFGHVAEATQVGSRSVERARIWARSRSLWRVQIRLNAWHDATTCITG